MAMQQAKAAGVTVHRFGDAQAYEAPNHRLVRSLRLQGMEAGGSAAFWVGLSHILPGGGAGPDSSPLEKTYVVIAGELTVMADGQEWRVGPFDSCAIAPNVVREMENRTNAVVTMVVVMPPPPRAA